MVLVCAILGTFLFSTQKIIMLTAFLFALKITLPNILLMLLGVMMQKKQTINQSFVEIASDMVFN